MKYDILSEKIIYFPFAIDNPQQYIDFIEVLDGTANKVIPDWSVWQDAGQNDSHHNNNIKGYRKQIDWNIQYSPDSAKIKPDISKYFSEDHLIASKFVDPINDILWKCVKMYQDMCNIIPCRSVTKNFEIRKYAPGEYMGNHKDVNEGCPTMDYSALIYLNDDYEGGELHFVDKDILIKPKAGSIILFPADETHRVAEVKNGWKYYLPLFWHSTEYQMVSFPEPTAKDKLYGNEEKSNGQL